jgi:hypothetical protein
MLFTSVTIAKSFMRLLHFGHSTTSIGFKKLQPKLKKLGKHSTGVSCLYVRRLADVDVPVLESIVRQAVREAKSVGRGI